MCSGRCRRSASAVARRADVVPALGEDERSLHPAQKTAPVAMARRYADRRKQGIPTDEDTPVRPDEFQSRWTAGALGRNACAVAAAG